jgi:hypothetical protein
MTEVLREAREAGQARLDAGAPCRFRSAAAEGTMASFRRVPSAD